MARKKSHKDVEFAVDDASGKQRIFKRFDEAASFAVSRALNHGTAVNLDALVYSRAGARWLGGEDAVQQYDEDPDASVSERIQISVNHVGRVY